MSGLFDVIESSEFKFQLSVLSGLSSVLVALHRDEVVQRLIEHLRAAPETGIRVLERVKVLAGRNPMPEYMHPYDEALAAYLYALSKTDIDLTHQAADLIAQGSGLWWAKRMASYLVEESAHDC